MSIKTKIKDSIKQLTCSHLSQDLVFIENLHGDAINNYNARSVWMCSKCHKIIYRNRIHKSENISDGYHTFKELYHHRAILTAVVCHNYKDRCWKSLKHSDGTMYPGMFIVGINTPEGPATYHYDCDPYWFMFDVKELPKAPEWDGHTPDDAIKRIESLLREEKNAKKIIKK